MPSFSDWLRGSWEDYRRRWTVLLAVAGTGGAASLAAGFAPFVPASLATAFGLGPAWAVWAIASLAALLLILWLTTWTQAAMLRAALTGETAGACLSRGWAQTGAFGWVLTLVLLAVAGGYCLLLVPGLLLSVLLFAAPFSQIRGEAQGTRALGLSWARVRPRFGTVALRMFAATALGAAPGWIPYVGWIVMMFWAPFGLVALARLDRDLREADPAPAAPAWMGGAVAGLSAAFLVVGTLSAVLAARAVSEAARTFNEPGGLASRVKPETMQALLDSFSGQATDEQKRAAEAELLAELRAPAGAPGLSTGTAVSVSSAAAVP